MCLYFRKCLIFWIISTPLFFSVFFFLRHIYLYVETSTMAVLSTTCTSQLYTPNPLSAIFLFDIILTSFHWIFILVRISLISESSFQLPTSIIFSNCFTVLIFLRYSKNFLKMWKWICIMRKEIRPNNKLKKWIPKVSQNPEKKT